MSNLSPLHNATIFRGFAPDQIATVSALGTPQTFARGSVIFNEGDPGSYLYLVLDGSVSIHCGDKCIARCRTNEAFGEMAAFRHRDRSATARAATDVSLLLFDEAALARLMEGPLAVPLLLNVIHVLCERLEAGNTWIACSLEAQRQQR